MASPFTILEWNFMEVRSAGWRHRSASDLRRLYADVGVKGSLGVFHLSFAGAANDVGADGPNLLVTGSGVFLDDASDGAGPVQLLTTNTYAGVYVTDTLDVTTQLSVTAGARFNVAQIRLSDLLGTRLDGTHEFTRFNP